MHALQTKLIAKRVHHVMDWQLHKNKHCNPSGRVYTSHTIQPTTDTHTQTFKSAPLQLCCRTGCIHNVKQLNTTLFASHTKGHLTEYRPIKKVNRCYEALSYRICRPSESYTPSCPPNDAAKALSPSSSECTPPQHHIVCIHVHPPKPSTSGPTQRQTKPRRQNAYQSTVLT